MSTAKQRATAAKSAYKKTKSPSGVYSMRAFVKDAYGKQAARAVGKSLVQSAREPGKSKSFVKLWGPKGRKAQILGRRSDIDYHKMVNTLGHHVTFGEARGSARNIEKTYRQNLRQMRHVTATAKKTARNS